MSDGIKVSMIKFTVVADGKASETVFLRPEKIDDLLNTEDMTLGAWLRMLVKATKELQ